MTEEQDREAIIAMERAALDRWAKGDPAGFLEITAPDVAYFDPYIAHRIDSRDALAAHYVLGMIHIDRYEFSDPRVQLGGDVGVLTYNYVSWSGESENRWNCTEVYQRTGEGWRIIQSHWSFTQAGS